MKRLKPRTIILVAGALTLLIFGAWLNRSGHLDSELISSTVRDLGAWALPAYVAVFVIGGLLQIPGVVFVVAAPLIFGPTFGFVVAYVGALSALSLTFLLVRFVRGRGSKPVSLPFAWARRLLERAESRPFVSVVVLRLVFFLAPPLNVGLGLSSLRTRDYIAGSAVGIIAPMAVVVCAAGLI